MVDPKVRWISWVRLTMSTRSPKRQNAASLRTKPCRYHHSSQAVSLQRALQSYLCGEYFQIQMAALVALPAFPRLTCAIRVHVMTCVHLCCDCLPGCMVGVSKQAFIPWFGHHLPQLGLRAIVSNALDLRPLIPW